nr:hypothetical protein [Neobacillus sp. Marseille-Q6967]
MIEKKKVILFSIILVLACLLITEAISIYAELIRLFSLYYFSF